VLPVVGRGGFPPPEVPGSFFPVTPPVPLRGCSIGSWSLFRWFRLSSKSVARSAGLRSSAPVSCSGPRPFPSAPARIPLNRSPGPFRSRPLVSSVSVQFVSFRPFVARSSSPVCSVLCSFQLVFRSSVFRSARLVQFRSVLSSSRSGFVRFGFSLSFASFELLLCSRLLAFGFNLYYSRVYYTLQGAKGK